MIQMVRHAISLWATNRPLLHALVRLAYLLIYSVQAHSESGKYISATEWERACAAARMAYERAAKKAGWTPVKTAKDILAEKQGND